MVVAITVLAAIGAVPSSWKFAKDAKAAASQAIKEHRRSKYQPYVVGQPLLITIEQDDYNTASHVCYAEIRDASNNPTGMYWAPFPTTSTKKGQVVHAKRITVLFDTSNFLTSKPACPGSPTPTPLPAPPKSMPAPTTTPPGTGAIICIKTDVGSDDACSTSDPILLDPVDVQP